MIQRICYRFTKHFSEYGFCVCNRQSSCVLCGVKGTVIEQASYGAGEVRQKLMLGPI